MTTQPMIETPAELSALLVGTALADRSVVSLPILKTGTVALALSTTHPDLLRDWQVLRDLLGRTGRWPLVVGTGHGRDLMAQLLDAELFSRFPYEDEVSAGKTAPADIVAAASKVKLDSFLRRRSREVAEESEVAEYFETELDATHARCGSAPALAELSTASLHGKPLLTRQSNMCYT